MPMFAANVGEEVGCAFEQLHGEEPAVVFVEELVEREEVFVGELGERTELDFEAVDTGRVDVAQSLEGHAGLAFAIEGFVDDAHSSRAEAAQDGEAGIALEWLFELSLELLRHGCATDDQFRGFVLRNLQLDRVRSLSG